MDFVGKRTEGIMDQGSLVLQQFCWTYEGENHETCFHLNQYYSEHHSGVHTCQYDDFWDSGYFLCSE